MASVYHHNKVQLPEQCIKVLYERAFVFLSQAIEGQLPSHIQG